MLGYHPLNCGTGATYPDATVTFGYDAIGRLTSVNDSVGGTIAWTYDTVSSGHHPRVQETTTPGTVTVEYDEIGRRLKLSATGQTDVTYTYDKNSRLKTVTQGTQTVTLAYDDAGRRTSLTYPNGVVTSYGYDNANRLLSIDHIKTPTTIEALTYLNDAAGNRVKLTRANAAASLIPIAVSSNSYDVTNQQTQFNGVTQTFDANGNLTNDGTNTYTWDARNRLTGISGGVTATFTYDGLGRRKTKTIGGTTTGFWYDGHDVLAKLSGSTPTATYIRGLSIDEPFIRKQSGGDEFYQADALGTTLALTDGSGTTNTSYTQEPFGKTTKAGASTNSFQFTGRENDATGLYYYRARYYSPALHRFVSEDPLEFAAGDTNLFAYVFDSPTNYTDPSGEVIPLLFMCARVGLNSVGMDVLAGRKIDWVGAGIDCATGGFGKVRALDKIALGLVTPGKYFGSKTVGKILQTLTKKFGPPKSTRPDADTFYNPRTQRSFNVHTDPAHGPPHVDVRRRGGYPERKYPLAED
jgi:RHS repeat-associated protein